MVGRGYADGLGGGGGVFFVYCYSSMLYKYEDRTKWFAKLPPVTAWVKKLTTLRVMWNACGGKSVNTKQSPNF